MKTQYPPFERGALRRIRASDWAADRRSRCPWECRQAWCPILAFLVRPNGVTDLVRACHACGRPWTERWRLRRQKRRAARLLGAAPGHPPWVVVHSTCGEPSLN
jgi:hypothetical protein